MSNKDLNWVDGRSTSPVNIPKFTNDHQTRHEAMSAPGPDRRIDLSTRSALIDPVVEESEVLISSSVRSDASLMKRRKEAELGDLSSAQHYGASTRATLARSTGGEGGGGGEPIYIPRELEQSAEIVLEDYVKIATRNKRAEHATSNVETIIHMLKSNVGSGVLTLPLAVGNAGLLIGPFGLLFMGIIATHCMLQLITCTRELCKRFNIKQLNYSEVAKYAVIQYTPNKPIWGKVASSIVNIFLLITQFGFCSVYFVFIADNLVQIFDSAFNVNLERHVWIAILILPMVVLSWIRNLDELTAFSMVANVCILASLLIIFYAEINSFFTSDESEKAAVLKGKDHIRYYGTLNTLPLFFGQAVYSFEGIGMVLPLENKMRSPRYAKRLILLGMSIVIFLFIEFGTLGYVVYGVGIQPSISLNLKSNNTAEMIFFLLAKLLYAYATLASFLLQFYVPMDFLEPPLYEKMKLGRLMYYLPRHHDKVKFLVQICFRTSLVVLTACIALAVPDLNDLIALIGAVASSSLALIFPSLLAILVFWRKRSETHWLGCLPWPVWVVKDILIALLGVIGTGFGTYASILSIVCFFQHSRHSPVMLKACNTTSSPS